MKRKMNGKLAMIVAAAMLCMTGCGMESLIQDDSMIGSESLPGMVKVEDSAEEDSSVQEQEEDSFENSVNQVEYDVQQTLEDAEREASALKKKLTEDPTLTQADMNTLSMEIYQVWDGVLNDLWNVLKSTLDEENMDKLLQEQRAWISEKEAEVKEAGEAVGGGSMAPMVANQRAAKLTRERVYELASHLGFEGTLITFTVEGMEEVVPATVFEGLHYTLSIPTEGWEVNAPECWLSTGNGEVQFWVTDYAGEDVDSVLEKLAGVGYEKREYDPYHVSYVDEEGMVHQVKLFSENNETVGIFSCYPKEAEEGFGARIRTIIDTFDWDIK